MHGSCDANVVRGWWALVLLSDGMYVPLGWWRGERWLNRLVNLDTGTQEGQGLVAWDLMLVLEDGGSKSRRGIWKVGGCEGDVSGGLSREGNFTVPWECCPAS